MITLLAASFRGRRFILEGGGTGTAACAGAGEGCWGQGGHCQPLPTSPSLMYSVSDSSQLPWDFGIMDTLGAVLINPGDVDPPGVVTVTTPPQPPPPPERAGRCLPAATADLQLTGKSTHPIKGSLRLLLSIANSRLSQGKPPVSPVGVWGSRGKPCRGVQAAGAPSFIKGRIREPQLAWPGKTRQGSSARGGNGLWWGRDWGVQFGIRSIG